VNIVGKRMAPSGPNEVEVPWRDNRGVMIRHFDILWDIFIVRTDTAIYSERKCD
jgi:hypothetical protein